MLSALELCRMSATDILIVLLGLERECLHLTNIPLKALFTIDRFPETNPGVPQTQLSPLQLDCVEVIIGGPSTEGGFSADACLSLWLALTLPTSFRGSQSFHRHGSEEARHQAGEQSACQGSVGEVSRCLPPPATARCA